MTVSKIRLNGTDHDLRAKYLETTSSSEAKSVEFITRTTTEEATVATVQKIYGNTATVNSNLVPLTATSIQAKDSNNNIIGSSTLNITSLTGKLNGAGSSVTVFSDGMKKARVKYDEIEGAKATKRTLGVDLGTLAWTDYVSSSHRAAVSLPSCVPVGRTNLPDLLCAGYTTVAYNNIGTVDKTICLHHTSQTLYMTDASLDGKTGTQIASALSGIMLFYETTTSEYTLDTPIQSEYQVITGGTESIVPSDPSLSAPIKMDVLYGNAADTISNLPANYISVDSMKDFLSALGTQMNGTWTMQYADGKYTFTFTST